MSSTLNGLKFNKTHFNLLKITRRQYNVRALKDLNGHGNEIEILCMSYSRILHNIL